jgi:hypothetical protein
MYNARVLRERMAKNAVVLPTVIKVRRTTTTITRPRALRGIRRVGWTYIVWCLVCKVVKLDIRDVFTCEKNGENGRPPSRANAHTKRDTEARVLKSATIPLKMIQLIRNMVAPLEFVAVEST